MIADSFKNNLVNNLIRHCY